MININGFNEVTTKINEFEGSSLDKNLDLQILYKNRVIPFDEDGYSIFCFSDSFNNNLISNIEYITKKNCKINILKSEEIDYLLKNLKNKSKKRTAFNLFLADKTDDIENIKIINYLNFLFEEAIENNITDIHIEPFKDIIRIRFRQDGKLFVKENINIDYYSIIITRIKILGKLDIAERRLPQDGRISFEYDKREIDLRISFVPTITGEKIAIRLLDSNNKYNKLEMLGFSKDDLNYIKEEIKKMYGLMLFVGPTGSGKTTSIYSILNELNKEDINITTLEDPVEYKLEGINQIQINTKQGLLFHNTLKNILRQDPDIISIGEMRDEETVQTALRASITGHFVLSTLHTKDSISAVMRLKDMGSESYLIASALNSVISQRLVRLLCNKCKEKSSVNLKRYGITSHYVAKGCDYCNDGYIGRIAVFEVLKVNDRIKLLISNNSTYEEIKKAAEENNFITIKESLINLVNVGKTSFEEIIKLI